MQCSKSGGNGGGYVQFVWRQEGGVALHNAGVTELFAQLASEPLKINPKLKPMQSVLPTKHYFRKTGSYATYGQSGKN